MPSDSLDPVMIYDTQREPPTSVNGSLLLKAVRFIAGRDIGTPDSHSPASDRDFGPTCQ